MTCFKKSHPPNYISDTAITGTVITVSTPTYARGLLYVSKPGYHRESRAGQVSTRATMGNEQSAGQQNDWGKGVVIKLI